MQDEAKFASKEGIRVGNKQFRMTKETKEVISSIGILVLIEAVVALIVHNRMVSLFHADNAFIIVLSIACVIILFFVIS